MTALDIKPDEDGHRVKATLDGLDEIRAVGLLWFINRVALHPRGMALALAPTVDGKGVTFEVWFEGEPWCFVKSQDDLGFDAFAAFEQQLRNAIRPTL